MIDAMVRQLNGNGSKTSRNDKIVRCDVSAIGYLLGRGEGVMLKGGAGERNVLGAGYEVRERGKEQGAQRYFRRLSTRLRDSLSVQSWYPIVLERMIP